MYHRFRSGAADMNTRALPSLQMFDVQASQQADGVVCLRQLDYSGNEAVIVLHARQLTEIVAALGLHDAHGRRIDRLVRTVADQVDGLAALVFAIETSPYDHIEPEVPLRLLALLDVVALLTAEFDGATACHEKAAPIIVTPKKPRGRPAKGAALTPAERQRQHRERQAALPLETETIEP